MDEAEELVSSSSQEPRFVNAGVQTYGPGKSGKQKGSNLHILDEVELKNILTGIARWRIWKRRCSYRMQIGYAPKVSVLFQFKYDLQL